MASRQHDRRVGRGEIQMPRPVTATIIVAVISAGGGVAAAFIANWDKIFAATPSPAQKPDYVDDQLKALTPGLTPEYLTTRWDITNGADRALGPFVPRNIYVGHLAGSVQGKDFILEGEVVTENNVTKVEKGRANFKFVGPISNRQAAGYYTYSNKDVSGFGSGFFEVDASGAAVLHLVFRITHPSPTDKGDIGAAELDLKRDQ